MAANLFGQYVWLIDTLCRYKRLTFQEISELWQESGLGYGEKLPLRTFHNHQKTIKDIFDVYIDCDRKDGYRYYIDEPKRLEGNNLQSWLISSYAILNQIQADNKLEDRIIFEDIPSGQTWLTPITEAMRRNHVLSITHHGFGKPEASTFEIESYCLKVVKHRWYVVARSPYYSNRNKEKGIKPADVYQVYALDCISDIQDVGKTFKMKKNFDVNHYFEGCCGVVMSNEPIQHIVPLAYGGFADYLRTLPLHESQREIEGDNESTLFEYHLKPTFDFYQIVLAQGGQVEVLELESVRNEYLKDIPVLVAHNAAFDIGCIRHSLELYGMEKPDITYYCSLRAARKFYNFGCNSLDYLCDQFKIPYGRHHQAEDDAEMCVRLFLRELDAQGVNWKEWIIVTGYYNRN